MRERPSPTCEPRSGAEGCPRLRRPPAAPARFRIRYRPGRFPLPDAAAAAAAARFFPVPGAAAAAAPPPSLRLRFGLAESAAAGRRDRAAAQADAKASRVSGAPSASTTLNGILLGGDRGGAKTLVVSKECVAQRGESARSRCNYDILVATPSPVTGGSARFVSSSCSRIQKNLSLRVDAGRGDT